MEQAVVSDVYNIPRRVSVIYIGHLFSFIRHRQPGETLSKRSQGRFLISRFFLKGIFVYANRGRAALILAEKLLHIYILRIVNFRAPSVGFSKPNFALQTTY